MRRFTIQTTVTGVSGKQHWTVDAETDSEALKKYESGDCEFEAEEIEVVDTSNPQIIKVEDL